MNSAIRRSRRHRIRGYCVASSARRLTTVADIASARPRQTKRSELPSAVAIRAVLPGSTTSCSCAAPPTDCSSALSAIIAVSRQTPSALTK